MLRELRRLGNEHYSKKGHPGHMAMSACGECSRAMLDWTHGVTKPYFPVDVERLFRI